jgi:NTE family protein
LGLSGENGNVFQSRAAIDLADGIAAGSLFLGCDTFLGPLCIAYGRTDGGRSNYYLTLGQSLGGRRPGFGGH